MIYAIIITFFLFISGENEEKIANVEGTNASSLEIQKKNRKIQKKKSKLSSTKS